MELAIEAFNNRPYGNNTSELTAITAIFRTYKWQQFFMQTRITATVFFHIGKNLRIMEMNGNDAPG